MTKEKQFMRDAENGQPGNQIRAGGKDRSQGLRGENRGPSLSPSPFIGRTGIGAVGTTNRPASNALTPHQHIDENQKVQDTISLSGFRFLFLIVDSAKEDGGSLCPLANILTRGASQLFHNYPSNT